jgi:hypothetical protein
LAAAAAAKKSAIRAVSVRTVQTKMGLEVAPSALYLGVRRMEVSEVISGYLFGSTVVSPQMNGMY